LAHGGDGSVRHTARGEKVNLTPRDLEMFAAIGVPEFIVRDAGVRRVTHDEAREICGIRYKSEHLEGLAIPYRIPDGGKEPIATWSVRRDNPEMDSEGHPIGKYLRPPDRKHWYFSGGAYPLLADVSAPVIFVESPKSVLAIEAARLKTNRTPWPLVIAIDGCWGFWCVTGKTTSANGARVNEKGPAPDFDRITWTGRTAYIAFDSNAASNEKVQAARRALAAELDKRGATVRVVEVPKEPGINGPDDYIGRQGAAAFWELVDAARPATAIDGGRAVTLTRASDIRPRPVLWLWLLRLALGTLNLLGGREGIGKSIVAATLTADVTRGRLPGVYFGTPRSVIIAATEDTWDYTIVPRFDGRGCGLDKGISRRRREAGWHRRNPLIAARSPCSRAPHRGTPGRIVRRGPDHLATRCRT
jgi:hypothetical protein